MTESMGRWGAAAAMAVIVGLALALALSPTLGSGAALIIGLAGALGVAGGVLKHRPDLLQK